MRPGAGNQNSGYYSAFWLLDSGSWLLVLISEFLIYDIAQRLALSESLEVIQKELHRLVEPVRGVVGAMRREQNIVEAEKGVACRQGFGLEHVESRAPNSLFAQGRN